MENFEKATRAKLRFSTNKGNLSVEDLWDLSLQSLDSIAKGVNKQLKEESEESFIAPVTKSKTDLDFKMEILKHIIAVKIGERDAAKVRAEKEAKKEHLKNLLEAKEMEALGNKSLDEIKSMIAELED